MAVCRLNIGPIYTPIKILNPPCRFIFKKIYYYNVRPALCQVLNLMNYTVCVQNNLKIHCLILSRPTKLFLVAGILYFLTESQ